MPSPSAVQVPPPAPPMTGFVGRQQELAVLGARLSEAVAGQGGVALVAGEAGIGKTRTVRAFADAAGPRGTLVLWGRCYEGEWSPPFAPWVEAIGGFVRASDPERVRDALGLAAPSGATSLAQLVPDLAPLVADLPALVALGPDEERFRLFDAVVRFLLRLAARQPLVIVLDDLHWADRATLDLLRHLVYFAAHARLLVVGTYRDLELDPRHPLSSVLPVLRREAGATPITLKGLPLDEVAALLGSVGGDGWSGQLAQTIYAETNGNPFFIEELLRHLVDEVKLVAGGNGWSAPAGLTELGIPEGVRQVVGRRLARLSPDTARLLTHAAVFTGGFDFAVLQPLTGSPEDALLAALDEALAARLIQPAGTGRERYDFVHAIVRHALSESWSPSRRVRLHRRAAEALARVYQGREREHAPELAVQYYRSASLPGAAAGIPHALAAAEQARRGHAAEQTVAFLRMARDLAAGEDAALRTGIVRRLAIAEAEAVMIEEGRRTIDDALATLDEGGGDPAAVADFLADAALALKARAQADSRVWRPLVERGLGLVGDRRDRTWARLMLLVDPIEPVSRETIRAGRWRGFDPAAVAIARSTGDEEDYARSVESFDPRTRAETDALVSLARTWLRPTAIMYTLTVAANDFQFRHGAFRDAAALWDELIERSERSGALSWQEQAASQLTWLHIACGRFAEARDTEARSDALRARLGRGLDPQLVAMEHATAFAVYLGGDWAAIAAFWTQLIDDPAMGPHDVSTLAGTLYGGLAAYAHAEAGAPGEARRLLETLTPILERTDPTTANQNHNGAVAFAAAAVWRLAAVDLAPVYRRLAVDLIAAGIGDHPQGSNELTVARMAALLGNAAEATDHFTCARQTLAVSGQRPLRAIVDLDEAAFLASTGPTGHARVTELLSAALAEFEALAMAPWVERARAVQTAADARAGRLPLPAGLTEREVDVLRLVARGQSDREISDALFISPRTVNAHLRNMLNKADAANRTELSIWAFAHGLVSREEQ